jgi:glutamate/tyrosine decarboxylase-like PLP-dependent enzyme
MLEDMFDHLEHLRDQPVWRAPPDEVRARFRAELPRGPQDLAATHLQFRRDIAPYSSGNSHPGFMGWVQGGGTAVGMLAEMLAAGLNSNLGGRDHAPIEVERQIVAWMAQLFGFPQDASGVFLTGASAANFCAVLIARTRALGVDARSDGVGTSGLVAYASTAAHNCIGRGMDMAGLGSANLRLIKTDALGRISLPALRRAIVADRAAGLQPFLVVGTAGTVDIGAIDDLQGLAMIARQEGLAFHVDGAFGALGILSPEIAPRLVGIELADSLAFDFHKWGQVPYDAGFLLVRDPELHKATFASQAAYLRRDSRGLAGGDWWPCDFGPDLSRGFRALKVWFTLKTYGLDALGAAITRTCELARALEARVLASPELELMAPVQLNIVCFGYRSEDDLNAAIVADLQEAGRVAPSTTTLDGRTAIRAAIVNHRTGLEDIDALVNAVLARGRAACAPATPSNVTTLPFGSESMDAPPQTLGLSYLAQRIFDQDDINPIWSKLVDRATVNPQDAGAFLDISIILQLTGQPENGLEIQRQALQMSPLYRRVHGDGTGLRILALAAPGDMMANTPVEFLLEGSNAELHLLYVGPGLPVPETIPDHDVAFLAIGESTANQAILAGLKQSISLWPQVVVNGAPQRIAALSRDVVSDMFGSGRVLSPVTRRLARATVMGVIQGLSQLEDHLSGEGFPIIIRPIDSHAGRGLEKIDDADELAAYLDAQPAAEFYLSPFVDYRSADGLFRKQRIAFIGGVPYASHMAISDHWMVHYLSAGMAERAERREEEEAFMTDFDIDFAARHAEAFAELHAAFGLDYFAIDCGETPDGRLLLFEADVAMIVHAMDCETLYPYKKPAMRKLFDAFLAHLEAAAHSQAVAEPVIAA